MGCWGGNKRGRLRVQKGTSDVTVGTIPWSRGFVGLSVAKADETPRPRDSGWFDLGLLKKQIAKRLSNLFLQQILQQFNEGLIDITEASFQLQIGRTHLYRLPTRFLRERSHFAAKLPGGDHWPAWLPEAIAFLKEFIPLQKPPNFQLVADELATRLGFKRHRESVAAFARTHFPDLICQPEPRPKARRRWQRSHINELPLFTSGGPLMKSKPCC